MKHLRLLALLLLASCSATQIASTRAIADPLVSAAVTSYAASQGVPPMLTAPLVVTLQNEFWSLLAQKQAGNPIAQGASIPAVGQAVAAKNPTQSQLVTSLVALGAQKAQAMLPAKVNIWNHKVYYYKK